MSVEKLLPCWHCGGEPKVMQADHPSYTPHGEGWYVICKCGATLGYHGTDEYYKLQYELAGEDADRLTAERDKLKELNGYHAAQYELASEDCDRLQAQVDAKDNCIENIMQTLHETQARASNLADDLLTANRQREQYRKLFGMALDWAHEITMLESSIDEGMA